MSSPLDDLAVQIAAGDPGMRLRQAVVTAVASNGTVTLNLSGSTTDVPGVPCLASYFFPNVGDVVQVLAASAASLLVLAPAAPTVARGYFVGPTDASGYFIITHNLGVSPGFIDLTNVAPHGRTTWPTSLSVDQPNNTINSIKCRAWSGTAVYTSATLECYWKCEV